jgi:hypothetical protein
LLGVLVIGLVGRLLAEWQRRKTLVVMVKHARAGHEHSSRFRGYR